MSPPTPKGPVTAGSEVNEVSASKSGVLLAAGGFLAGAGHVVARRSASRSLSNSGSLGKRPLPVGRSSSLFSNSSQSPARSGAVAISVAPVAVARICVSATTFDVQVRASVPKTVVEKAFPEVLVAGKTAEAVFIMPREGFPGHETRGELLVDGFDALPFSFSHNSNGARFVGAPGRWRYTALSATKWDWRANGDKPTEGRAADLELQGGLLRVQIRAASAIELKRCLQLQALREAEQGEDYDTLSAQVTKAINAGVEQEHIERAEERMKALRKQGLHVNIGCDKKTLQEHMHWEKVTTSAQDMVAERCTACSDCPCNQPESPCEVLEIRRSNVQEILGPNCDRELFEELSGAALDVEEGSVWKAGGKLIFSAFNRNQSVTALTRMLDNHGRGKCSKMLLQLVKASEKKYGGFVTAIQVNFHVNGSSYHDQHRDIYSAKQRAGPNCTCSFRECVGTVCYSLGSSRVCLLETMTDEASTIKPCGEACGGRRVQQWLHSGDAMYFNAAWNQNHTHGIPALKDVDTCGPRISVAFLLGAAEGAKMI